MDGREIDYFDMQDRLVRYFQGEKLESALFLAAACAALVACAWLVYGASTYRWMAAPLAAVALVQLAVGGTVLLRTNAQALALSASLQADSEAFRAAESARMTRVERGFRVYKAIEIALLAAGIALTYAGRGRPAMYAVGIGCVIEGALMLVFDLFAERRADAYLDAVRRFTP